MGNTTTANFVRTVFSLSDKTRVETVCFARGSVGYGGGEDGSYAQTYIKRHCEHYFDHTSASGEAQC